MKPLETVGLVHALGPTHEVRANGMEISSLGLVSWFKRHLNQAALPGRPFVGQRALLRKKTTGGKPVVLLRFSSD
jgi:hypothetical protein